MTWVKIDDGLPNNPKLRLVSLQARWAYVSSICYSSRAVSDGFVPKSALALVDGTAKVARELTDRGLWESAAGGWLIHDYLQYNRSREQIERQRTTASMAGRASVAARFGAEQDAERPDEPHVERNVQRNGAKPFLSLSEEEKYSTSEERERGGVERAVEQDVEQLRKPRRRLLTVKAVQELQREFPRIDVEAAARDYLNWSGSEKHIDKVHGLRNQLRSPKVAEKFPRGRAKVTAAAPDFGLAEQTEE